MHLSDGELRSALDQSSETAANDHLAACADCRRRADEIAQRAQRVDGLLAVLEPARSPALGPQAALARFKSQRLNAGKENGMVARIFRRYRAAWAAALAVLVLAASMAFPPVRAWAEGVLAQFRVSKIQIVNVSSSHLGDLGAGTKLTQQISKMLSDSITYTQKPSAPVLVASAAEASQKVGFPVRLPSSRTDTPQLRVQSGGAFQLIVNRDRTQSLLDQAGASDLQLPASIDGAVIKVTIPAGVAAGYGDCPAPQELDSGASGSSARLTVNCIYLTEIPSPTVDAPPSLDVQQLAELGLQFSGMSKAQAEAYAKTVDWTSTLVIPIPTNAAQYKPVTVDGSSGYLIQRPQDDAPQYTIIWVKDGVIYDVAGTGPDTTAAFNIANSLN
ncbi:MAG: DUF2275 domain-containing protein [Chloroflexi bacterium]|nr:DUF2275 domain-containing protein [Chloroflexota bacterium]